MQLTLQTGRVTDAVTLAEVRRWLNFTDGITEDEPVLEELIDEAYDFLEDWTNRKIVGQTWNVTLDACEIADEIRLPMVPLVSVSQIVTTDDDGDETTVTSTNYQVRAGANPRVVLTSTGEWPSDYRDHDAMEIRCVCGYNLGTSAHVGFEPADNLDPGSNDLRAGGTFDGDARTSFEVEVTSLASADVFKWRKITRTINNVKTYGSWTTSVAMTGSAQTLDDGVTVTFESTQGHKVGDKWNVQVYEVIPDRVKLALKGVILHFYSTKGRGLSETVSGQLIGMPRTLERSLDSLRVEAW